MIKPQTFARPTLELYKTQDNATWQLLMETKNVPNLKSNLTPFVDLQCFNFSNLRIAFRKQISSGKTMINYRQNQDVVELWSSGLQGRGCSTKHAMLSIISCVTRGVQSVTASQGRPCSWSDLKSHRICCNWWKKLWYSMCLQGCGGRVRGASSSVHAAFNIRIGDS